MRIFNSINRKIANINRQVTEFVGPENVNPILGLVAAGNIILMIHWTQSSSPDKNTMQLGTYFINMLVALKAQELLPERGIGYAVRCAVNSFVATSKIGYLQNLGRAMTVLNTAQILFTEQEAPRPN